MTLERGMYKLLLVTLTLIALTQAFGMVLQIAGLHPFLQAPAWVRVSLTVSFSLQTVTGFLSALMMLYWIPRIIAHLFPGVRG